jgi:glucokinase
MSGPIAIGADLGGSKLLTGVVDSDYAVLWEQLDTSVRVPQSELLELIGDRLGAALREHPAALAAGLGIPSTIDQAKGTAIMSVNVDLAGVPIRELVQDRLGLPAFNDNDGNLAALAEQRAGAARGARDMVLLTIGTGIGGGLILGGEVYRGSIGAGAELGHMVVDADGPPCQGNCPNHGCLEAVASGTALARDATEAARREAGSVLGKALAEGATIDPRLAIEAALGGDAVARECAAAIGRKLGAGLVTLANVFNPEVIVIGGGVMALGELLLGPAREELGARALRPMNETPVVAAHFGANAGMIGAAAMALTEVGRLGEGG